MYLNLQMGNGSNANHLPSGYIFRTGPDGVDTVGLSISEFWSACPVAHRTLYSANGTAFYDAATIISNIEASPYLNDGGELVGSVSKGYAQYPTGTVMLKAYKYFGFSVMPVHPPYSGLVANYRASSLDLSNDALIAAVPDYYLPSRDAVQATAGDKPFFITNAVGSFPAIQFRGSQILNLPAVLSVNSRSLSVFFISRINHKTSNEKIYAAIGGGVYWLYKEKPSPNASRAGLYSDGDTISLLPMSNQISIHGIGSNATKRKYFNGLVTSEESYPVTDAALTGGTIGGGYTDAYWPEMDMFECLIYDHMLTDEEYQELTDYADAVYDLNLSAKTKQVIFYGNSLMAGNCVIGSGTIPNRYADSAPSNIKTYNLGQDSMTTPQLISAASTNIYNLYGSDLDRNIAVVWEGRNDVAAGSSKEDALAHLITLCQGLVSAGFEVVIGTCLPTGGIDGSTWETARAYINSAITTSFVSSGYAHAVADVASSIIIGEYGDNGDTTYYADTVHLNSAGVAIAAPYFTNAINSIISYSPSLAQLLVRIDILASGVDSIGGDNTLLWDSGTPGDDAATCHILYTAAVAAIIPSMFSGTTPLVKTWAQVRELSDNSQVFIGRKALVYSVPQTGYDIIRASNYVGILPDFIGWVDANYNYFGDSAGNYWGTA